MDAMEFIRERNRMCKAFPSCKGCPACDFDGCGSVHLNERIIPIVEKWAKEHPRKTRQSVFLEQHPNVRLIDGVVDIAPCQMEPKSYSSGAGGCKYVPCVICRSEFWSQEVE